MTLVESPAEKNEDDEESRLQSCFPRLRRKKGVLEHAFNLSKTFTDT